ncbi:MAG: aminopeptidase P family protein [Alphaproteobacteria bacterium]|nr:aminopeptidase P family protein [Alphaproteobacteria bacterium]PHX99668.1 MAG: X-Pro aminopeptidase [Rhodospirillaceae bacterium]
MNHSQSQLRFAAQAQRLAALRVAMSGANVDAYIVPHADEHQGEYVAAYAARLEWLTGFSGSAGLAIVTKDAATVFIDGRYTLQVRDQVDGRLYEYRHLIDEPPQMWLASQLKAGMRLGFDPRLHTPSGLTKIEDAARKAGAEPVPVSQNLIDTIWESQPSRPHGPVEIYPDKFAGRTAAQKQKLVVDWLKAERLDAFIFSALDSIAWLFNIRSDDVEFTPLALGYALLTDQGKGTLFVEAEKITPSLQQHLGADILLAPYDSVNAALLGRDGELKTIGVDRDTGSRWLVDCIKNVGFEAKISADPVTAIKARKTSEELDGVRAAHLRDGAALTKFLAWLSRDAPKGHLTEIEVADKLASFRAEANLYRGPSFATIAGAGGNGAIVHYRASPDSNATIKPDMLLLVDSGGQYLDGTTDVTRTVVIGTPTSEQKKRFTLVLKGHIALGSARFVKGTTGSQLDALARHALWQEGLDYDHGTGHGVGTFLGVHEGPQRISKVGNTVALEPGMVISNEPGYYKTGEYGIRIENLVAVRAAQGPASAEKIIYEFETLTMAPIDVSLVDTSILTPSETMWLNAYHARVREVLAPLLDAETQDWLKNATPTL